MAQTERVDSELRRVVLNLVIRGHPALAGAPPSAATRLLVLTNFASRDDRLLPSARLVLGRDGDECPEPVRLAMLDMIESKYRDLPVAVSTSLRALLWEAFGREHRPRVLEAILSALGWLGDLGLATRMAEVAVKARGSSSIAGAYGYALQVARKSTAALDALLAEHYEAWLRHPEADAQDPISSVLLFSLPNSAFPSELQPSLLSLADLLAMSHRSIEDQVDSALLCQEGLGRCSLIPGVREAFLHMVQEDGRFMVCLTETSGGFELPDQYYSHVCVDYQPWRAVKDAKEPILVHWRDHPTAICPVRGAPASILAPVINNGDLTAILHIVLRDDLAASRWLLPVAARAAVALSRHVGVFRADMTEAELAELRKRFVEFQHPLRTWIRSALVSAESALDSVGADANGSALHTQLKNICLCLEMLTYNACKLNRWGEFSRRGRAPLAWQVVTVENLLRVAYITRAAVFGDRGPEKVRVVGDTDIRVLVDPGRVMEALFNLVENAIDHGAEHGEILIRIEDLATHCKIAVENKGDPIPDQYLHAIFHPYRQVPGSDRDLKTGYGVGLSVAQMNIHLHGDGYSLLPEAGRHEGAAFVMTVLKAPKEGSDE